MIALDFPGKIPRGGSAYRAACALQSRQFRMRITLPVLLLSAVVCACSVAAPAPQSKQTDGPNDPSDPGKNDNPPGGGTQPPGNAPPPPGPRPGIDAFPGSKMFMPPKTPAPGIIMLHGSEGGSETYIDDFATDIAKTGFVVVTMCWFGCTGKPDKILRIPLESVVDIGKWLATSPDVSGGNVGLFGWSRGAELSLLVSSLTGTAPYKAVAVHAPSDTVVAAFDPATENDPPSYGGIDENGKPAPSWTWQGKELFGEPDDSPTAVGPLIEVTKFTGPVYVSQGTADEVWPVTRGQHVVAERNAVPGLVTESHFFQGEGHVLMNPTNRATWTNEVSSFFQRKLP
jgi:dipeptidyl aminopeptidase/acylaminoacyl peptidase